MKYIYYYLLSIISVVGLFSSCISTEEINYLQPLNKQYSFQEFKNYKLAVGDMITCAISSKDDETTRVFGSVVTTNQNVLKIYRIYEDSTVMIPFFGTAKIAGKTVQESEAIIQKLVQESVKDAQVTVAMANNNFFVYAEDRRGSYPVYKDNLTIYQALGISQQTTGKMDISKVKILRRDDQGNTKEMTFDLRTQDVIQSEFYYIQPNDVIYFPTNKNSFFDISSLGSFTSALMIPLTFFLYSITYNF